MAEDQTKMDYAIQANHQNMKILKASIDCFEVILSLKSLYLMEI